MTPSPTDPAMPKIDLVRFTGQEMPKIALMRPTDELLQNFWTGLRPAQKMLLFAGCRLPGAYIDWLRMLENASVGAMAVLDGQPFACAWACRHGLTLTGTIHFMTTGKPQPRLVLKAGQDFIAQCDDRFRSLMALLPAKLHASIHLAQSLGFVPAARIAGACMLGNRIADGIFLLRNRP